MDCDLHTHSTASDGTTSPGQLAKLAKKAGLGAIALTDHDTTAGLARCARACVKEQIAFVPGIEISASPHALLAQGLGHQSSGVGDAGGTGGAGQSGGGGASGASGGLGTLHLLGLFIDPKDAQLKQVSDQMLLARHERNPAMVDKLNDLGVKITYPQVQALAKAQGTKIIGRPHIAQVLIETGYVKTMQDAFTRYLGKGAAAYVRRDTLPAGEAIQAIHHAGGLAILAHPIQLCRYDFQLLELLIRRLKDLGLDGIETRHSDHEPGDVARFERWAKKYQLLASGGSDYHGSRKPVELGSQGVPMEIYQRLKEAAAGGRGMR